MECSVGETRAASCTTAGKNLAAIPGSHTLAEAVLLGALTLFRLIGTKHVRHLLLILAAKRFRFIALTTTAGFQIKRGCGRFEKQTASLQSAPRIIA